MASEKVGMVPLHQHIHTGLNPLNPQPQLVFPAAFSSGPQPPLPKSTATTTTATRQLTSGFLDHRHFYDQANTQFHHQWNANVNANCRGGGSREDDDSDDEDDDDDGLEDEEGNNVGNAVTVAKNNDGGSKTQKFKQITPFSVRTGYMGQSGNESNNSSGEGRNGRGGEMYYAQYLNGAEGPSSSSGQKEIVLVEEGCGFSGRKEGSVFSEPGDSLRAILSDPITGTLMDDAMILPCGHSFGDGGIQHVVRMKACHTCSQQVSEDSIAPNLTLRVTVQAFRREEELQVNRASKRRREKHERDNGAYGDSTSLDFQRGRGVQFPFAVMDRVVIKGNKRTPPRFVGREAIVTTQCLNGWYVVKTLDNAESVKLQYRSLAKVGENPSSKPSPIRTTANWL